MKKLFGGNLHIGAGIDLNSSLSKLTGMSYENSMMKLKFGSTQVTDGRGNMDMLAFRDIAKSNSHGPSDLDVCNELSRVTGRDYKSLYYDMKKLDFMKLIK